MFLWFSKFRKARKVKEQTYWLVQDKGNYIFECTLNTRNNTIKTIPKDGELSVSARYNPNNLFSNKKDAIARQAQLKMMYESFQRMPYIESDRLEKNYEELLMIEFEINRQLIDYPNFDGIDFCDVRAGGIQIRGHHKAISGYTFGSQITIQYDFSDWKESIERFVESWKSNDIEPKVSNCKRFIELGNSCGWD